MIPHNKTPVAVLADKRDEGLQSPNKQKENTMNSTPTVISLDDGTLLALESFAPHHVALEITNARSIYRIKLDPADVQRLAESLLDEIAFEDQSNPESIDLQSIKTVRDVFRAAEFSGLTTGQILDLIEAEDPR